MTTLRHFGGSLSLQHKPQQYHRSLHRVILLITLSYLKDRRIFVSLPCYTVRHTGRDSAYVKYANQ